VTAAGGGGAGFPGALRLSDPEQPGAANTVAINAGSARAMRAPGHPQASFGMESIIDEMALALNMDPLELRIRNDPSRFDENSSVSPASVLVGKPSTAPRVPLRAPVKEVWGAVARPWGGWWPRNRG